MGVNRVLLIGNLGKDPEIRHLENGSIKASFPLATDEIYKNKEGEKISHTEWHNIVLWGKLAEVAEKYLKKGTQIYLEGRITSRSYTDKDGQVKHSTDIVARNLTILNKKNGTTDEKDHQHVPSIEQDEPIDFFA